MNNLNITTTLSLRSTVKVPVFAVLQLARCALPRARLAAQGSWVLPERGPSH